jgi:hypothetical protein
LYFFSAFWEFPFFFIWLIDRKKSEIKLRAQKQILDKIGTGQEAIQFFASKEGKELIESFSGKDKTDWNAMSNTIKKHEKPKNALKQVIETTTFGLLLLGAGFGLLLAAWFYKPNFFVWGAVLAFAGFGLLIAAGISYRLSNKWGIIRKELSDDQAAGSLTKE